MQGTKAHPRLSDKQIEVFYKKGQEVNYEKGATLIQAGAKDFDFFVILEGEVEIVDPFDENRIIASHQAGEFTGDSDMLSERTSVFKATAKTDVKAIRVSHDDLAEIIARHSDLSDLLVRAFFLRRARLLEHFEGGIILVGSRYSPETFKIREFLSKNHIRYTWLDLEVEERAEQILHKLNISHNDTPILIDADQQVYRNPGLQQIAECTGLASDQHRKKYDLLVVGAGPAGLAASVYAASEGLSTITIDQIGPGGQAGNSSKIENYLGFPMGISGSELANRAYLQAQKFGCTVSVPFKAKQLEYHGHYFELHLEEGDPIYASTVIAATGAQYRKLALDNIDHFKGRGVFYGATGLEARTCQDIRVGIVGGGNSAGQAAIFLSQFASDVHLFVRSDNLEDSMSMYLIKRIEEEDKIKLCLQTEVTGLLGDNTLEKVRLRHNAGSEEEEIELTHLFLFIGAEPCNDWLNDLTCTDDKGFVVTGRDLTKKELYDCNWNLKRPPYPLESSIPGLFVVGDLRSGSTKRVASAVGEGAMAVSYVHRFFS